MPHTSDSANKTLKHVPHYLLLSKTGNRSRPRWLPLQTAARVWDSLLAEGTKILYRVSLALLKLYESDLLGIDNAGDLINHLRHCTQRIHDRDWLMKVGCCASISAQNFGGRGGRVSISKGSTFSEKGSIKFGLTTL